MLRCSRLVSPVAPQELVLTRNAYVPFPAESLVIFAGRREEIFGAWSFMSIGRVSPEGVRARTIRREYSVDITRIRACTRTWSRREYNICTFVVSELARPPSRKTDSRERNMKKERERACGCVCQVCIRIMTGAHFSGKCEAWLPDFRVYTANAIEDRHKS